MENLKSFTEINYCRNLNCIYHESGNDGCRLKHVHIDIDGKCVYCDAKDSAKDTDMKYIREKIIPAIIDVFNKARIDLETVNNMGEKG